MSLQENQKTTKPTLDSSDSSQLWNVWSGISFEVVKQAQLSSSLMLPNWPINFDFHCWKSLMRPLKATNPLIRSYLKYYKQSQKIESQRLCISPHKPYGIPVSLSWLACAQLVFTCPTLVGKLQAEWAWTSQPSSRGSVEPTLDQPPVMGISVLSRFTLPYSEQLM